MRRPGNTGLEPARALNRADDSSLRHESARATPERNEPSTIIEAPEKVCVCSTSILGRNSPANSFCAPLPTNPTDRKRRLRGEKRPRTRAKSRKIQLSCISCSRQKEKLQALFSCFKKSFAPIGRCDRVSPASPPRVRRISAPWFFNYSGKLDRETGAPFCRITAQPRQEILDAAASAARAPKRSIILSRGAGPRSFRKNTPHALRQLEASDRVAIGRARVPPRGQISGKRKLCHG